MVLRKNYEIMGKKCYIPLYKPILKIKFTKKKFLYNSSTDLS